MVQVGSTTWVEVFADWSQRESTDPDWIEVATKVKGWPDWESWRLFTASQLGLADLEWQLYEFTNPMDEIPAMLMGPFTGWQSRVPTPNACSFADLVAIPRELGYWRSLEKIQGLIESYPCEAGMVGVVRPDSGKVVCIEGHHRATAVAVAQRLGQAVGFVGPVRIALANLPVDDGASRLNTTLIRGSGKDLA